MRGGSLDKVVEENEPHRHWGGGEAKVREGEVVLKQRGRGMHFVLCGGSAQASALSENEGQRRKASWQGRARSASTNP